MSAEARSRGGLTDILEQASTADQIKKMQPVDKAGVPDEWGEGLGYERPTPTPKPQRPKRRPVVVTEEFPVMDDEGNVLDLMPIQHTVWPHQEANDKLGGCLYVTAILIGMAIRPPLHCLLKFFQEL